MHGLGNDFVVLDLRQQALELSAEKARQLANRRTGVGCDQVLVLYPTDLPGAAARIDIWNADGSKAEQCGNGMRCLGLYLHQRGETLAGAVTVEGPVSPISLQNRTDGLVTADMGSAQFNSAAIPVNLKPANGLYSLALPGGPVELSAVSVGNPHAVVLVDDLDDYPVTDNGLAISTHEAFPQGCNAGFAQVIDRNTIKLRVFERGAGETLACGSGACAAAVALHQRGEVDQTVLVVQSGGELSIDTGDGQSAIRMTGPATYVFKGTIE